MRIITVIIKLNTRKYVQDDFINTLVHNGAHPFDIHITQTFLFGANIMRWAISQAISMSNKKRIRGLCTFTKIRSTKVHKPKSIFIIF